MKKIQTKKLVLFDIDGTLIHSSHIGVEKWKKRVAASITEVFGRSPVGDIDPYRYNGWVDRRVLWDIAQHAGVDRAAFEKHFPQLGRAFHKHLAMAIAEGLVYQNIVDAVGLVVQLQEQQVPYGLITGNFASTAALKLRSAGIDHFFSFGLFSDDVDDRIELARTAFSKSKAHFRRNFPPQEIVIIGDTVHDIRAGRAIGAVTIAVTTGATDTYETLVPERPDLVVDSLLDPRVLSMVGLSYIV